MSAASGPPQKTPLNALFREMKARLVDFAGWEMPLQFSSLLDEHHAVRAAAGLFDVSHMGEIAIRGPGALALVQAVTCNDAARLEEGQAQYSALTTEAGCIVDDILVYHRGPSDYLLVVNAGNTEADFSWIAAHAGPEVELQNVSARWALIALQGPRALVILQELTPADLGRLRAYRCTDAVVDRIPCVVSRTGYTGEDGFEIFCAPEAATDLFRTLMRAGEPAGLKPCGLGARDTLRLEAGMTLHGQDIDQTTSVLEAGLARIAHLDKGEFVGRQALRAEAARGPRRRLIGFEMTDPGIPRHGFPILLEGEAVGTVTSGTLSPTLRRGIGLAYAPTDRVARDQRIAIGIRGREAGARIVPLPFYRRPAPVQ